VKVLILGSGAKAHALAWALGKSHLITGLYVSPGNSGTAEIADNISLKDPNNPAEVTKLCTSWSIDYCLVATAAAQHNGMVEALEKAGVRAFGATKAAAQLEQNRHYAREFMQRHGVPTTEAKEFSGFDSFKKYIDAHQGNTLY